VNVDQCVTSTMEDAYIRDYNAVLLTDACATSSSDYCRQCVEFNAKNCWSPAKIWAAFRPQRRNSPIPSRMCTVDAAFDGWR
jgi:isochorismate hydrolase